MTVAPTAPTPGHPPDPSRDEAPELSVVIPCYGTAAILPELLARLDAALAALDVTYEMVLVDD